MGLSATLIRFRSWLKEKRKPLLTTGIIILFGLFFVGGYWFQWSWTGLPEHVGPEVKANQQYQPAKNAWDWLQVLAIPLVVGFGAVWYTTRQTKASDAENIDNQREAALQSYIDKMSDLLLHEDLRNDQKGEVRRVATLQTLIVLPRLDGKRKGSILLFLYEAGLIEKPDPIVTLGAAGVHGADLRGCDLSGTPGASLYKSLLSYALFAEADFTGMHLRQVTIEGGFWNNVRFIDADLRESELFLVNMREADFTGADLTDAILVAVDLTGAKVTKEQLDKAKMLQNITWPDGTFRP